MRGRIGVIHSACMRLHRINDPEILARDIIDILADVIPHDYAAVYRIEGDYLVPFAVNDRGLGPDTVTSDKEYLRELNLRIGENVTGWVAQNNQSVVIRDTAMDPRFLDSRPGVRSELCVPMQLNDAVTGVVNLESNQVGAYTESERSLLEIVASQLALSIENAELRKEVRRLRQAQHAD